MITNSIRYKVAFDEGVQLPYPKVGIGRIGLFVGVPAIKGQEKLIRLDVTIDGKCASVRLTQDELQKIVIMGVRASTAS